MLLYVKVAYADPDQQIEMPLSVKQGTTVEQAVHRSGILDQILNGLDWNSVSLGIFGRKVSKDAELMQNDRVEIYRPLQIDPKQARRLRLMRRDKKKQKVVINDLTKMEALNKEMKKTGNVKRVLHENK